MKRVSPKYVPREWMLVRAYTQAQEGDYTVVQQLHKLFERPYDEQPEMEGEYYVKPALTEFDKAGTAFMS
jgi:uncharacterized protein YdiU (UPF0061 family)